jgi:hypothetical protein
MVMGVFIPGTNTAASIKPMAEPIKNNTLLIPAAIAPARGATQRSFFAAIFSILDILAVLMVEQNLFKRILGQKKSPP